MRKNYYFKLSNKDTNKLVSFVDRYFTWDWRHMRREGETVLCDLIVLRKDDDGIKTTVYINTHKYTYLSIEKDGQKVYEKIITSFADVNIFKKMIICLG